MRQLLRTRQRGAVIPRQPSYIKFPVWGRYGWARSVRPRRRIKNGETTIA